MDGERLSAPNQTRSQARCHQMDDFGPAKNLMTMCFTYYHIGKPHLLPSEFKEKPAGSIDSYLKSANSWLAEKKDIAERLLKNTSAKTENVKGFFGLETKPKGPLARRSEEKEGKPQEKPRKTVTVCSPEEEKKGEKIYLYTHLKQQPIWHTLRFWNAAFFDAVHCERRKRSPTTRERWCHMTQEERDDSLRFNENITFGQLGSTLNAETLLVAGSPGLVLPPSPCSPSPASASDGRPPLSLGVLALACVPELADEESGTQRTGDLHTAEPLSIQPQPPFPDWGVLVLLMEPLPLSPEVLHGVLLGRVVLTGCFFSLAPYGALL
ncbi:hypothetical protein ESR_05888, partial [Eschrichtius robustus]|nr:hypothetical protein [Eschrichtius robustus]